ncbi:MAG: hypothetical protein ACR2QT_07390 [Woeseiaceae bacterium]
MLIKRVVLTVMFVAATSSAVAQQAMTGNFRISETTVELYDPATAEALSSLIAPDEEVQWQVFVPETYNPSNPPGVFVFADPDGWGGMPDQYRQLFSNRNLIWIGANSTQRNPEATRKMLKAIMALRFIDKSYSVNLNRTYIAGSEDETFTVINVMLQANEFNGALYINGSTYWDGGLPENFEFMVGEPHVFIIGTGDKRWETVRRHSEMYQKDGIANVELIYRSGRIRGWPDVEQMDEALAYLDAH